MGFFADAMRIIENKSADKANRRRGSEDLKQREVEALERIAPAVTSQGATPHDKAAKANN